MIARRAVLIAPALAGLFALGGRGFGQEFPTGPITFVVSFPPGGSIDVVMRAMAPKLQERLGKRELTSARPLTRPERRHPPKSRS